MSEVVRFLPIVFLLGAYLSLRRIIRSPREPGVPPYKIGAFWFGVAFFTGFSIVGPFAVPRHWHFDFRPYIIPGILFTLWMSAIMWFLLRWKQRGQMTQARLVIVALITFYVIAGIVLIFGASFFVFKQFG